MNNLAVITARGGSKGLPDKNIKMLHGKPLMAYSIDAAFASGQFNSVIVSTDSEEYAKIARSCGAEVPFLRSASNSSDTANSWDAVKEVLDRLHEQGIEYDTVCLLQPTSPLRTCEDIVAGYQLFDEKQADSVTSVCKVEHSPKTMMTLSEDLSMAEFRKNTSDLPRQMYKDYYRVNGALYIRRVTYDDNGANTWDNKEYALVMPVERSADIDTIDDFLYVDYLLQNNNRA